MTLAVISNHQQPFGRFLYVKDISSQTVNSVVAKTKYEYYMWCEPCLFLNKHVHHYILHALKTFPVVQCFEHAYTPTSQGILNPRVPGAAFSKVLEAFGEYETGIAWAARRDVFPLISEGSEINFCAWSGHYDHPCLQGHLIESLGRQIDIGHVPGDVIRLCGP